MSLDILPTTASPPAAGPPAIAPLATANQTAISDASPTPASDQPPTNAGSHAQKPASEAITGLTPQQVLHELRNSGYIDQLRRQMFDAFTASSSSAVRGGAAASGSAAAADAQAVASASQAAPSSSADPAIDASVPFTTAALPTPIDAAQPTPAVPTPTPSATAPLDIGTKPSFLSFLATPLRHQLEQQHGNLRNADTRGQQDQLLQLLESEPVDHAHRDALGDATLYDLLKRHIVVSDGGTGTAGMLDREGGSVGSEAMARIEETIRELLHPSAKDGEDEDEDEEEEEEEEHAVAADTASKSTAETQP
ncbi:conserved hypothetical protein [Sporisorium reilianum SRZ2]|uniref:Uncharacterized protein n=1 Tax=Sporisorium reilianum (strain SRZ2) TaxID=999809 RepID=E6ZUK4_SPORE|nr:conserved hypothetical protein [Sporisorium reilianum SRZ2]